MCQLGRIGRAHLTELEDLARTASRAGSRGQRRGRPWSAIPPIKNAATTANRRRFSAETLVFGPDQVHPQWPLRDEPLRETFTISSGNQALQLDICTAIVHVRTVPLSLMATSTVWFAAP